MASIVSNPKNFKVIKMTMRELLTIQNSAHLVVCDYCNKGINEGYYIAVLDQFFCEKCYQDWLKTAEIYEEDKKYETTHFLIYKSELEKFGFLNNR